jgi:4-diphosphocytidyl-2C-methyl-D-erythritol kinase
LAETIQAGRAITAAGLVNGFDGAADRVCPQFGELRTRLHQLAGQPFHLTGAGPSLFALFERASAARTAAARIQQDGIPAHVARSIARQPALRASHT